MDMQDSSIAEFETLKNKIQQAQVPADLNDKLLQIVSRAISSLKFSGQISSIEQAEKYIDLAISLPWNTASADNLDLLHAQEILDRNHYGLAPIKERIVEYLAVLKLKAREGTAAALRAPILCFVGLAGTGKTTIAYAIAESMGRKFMRIPFGGMGSSFDLRGQSRMHPDAEPGQIIKSIRRAGSNNPVILLDEIDRVSETGRNDIMGVLVELLDPEQNVAFVDHYLDYPFNLGNVLFIVTANNTKNISTAVLDRLEFIQMPSYTDEEKMIIAKQYMLQRELANCGLKPDQVTIDDMVWVHIVRPLGFDAGIRTLERTINGMCRKIARLVIEGKGENFHITEENVKQYLPTW